MFFKRKKNQQPTVTFSEMKKMDEKALKNLKKYASKKYPNLTFQYDDAAHDELRISIQVAHQTVSRIVVNRRRIGKTVDEIYIKALDTEEDFRKKGYAKILLKLIKQYAVFYGDTIRVTCHAKAASGENAMPQDKLEEFYNEHGIELI